MTLKLMVLLAASLLMITDSGASVFKEPKQGRFHFNFAYNYHYNFNFAGKTAKEKSARYTNSSNRQSIFKPDRQWWNNFLILVTIALGILAFFNLKLRMNHYLRASSQGRKYVYSALSESDAAEIQAQLLNAIDQQRLYLKHDLSINDLSIELNIPRHRISQVLNNYLHTSFYQLINDFRVRDFLQKIEEEQHRHYTLLSLSLDCGFKSKATFNRAFKRLMKISPSDYIKQKP
ncbi:MAG: helix-turn-helix domain-containing protein [Calditrichaeota bacterium]|nr:helix-turn-helix domain-containing protein [Calditrichota bacterium]